MNVNPIFKAGSKYDLNDYRPISILPTLSKMIIIIIKSLFSEDDILSVTTLI